MDTARIVGLSLVAVGVVVSIVSSSISKKEIKLAKMQGIKYGLDMAYDAKHGTNRTGGTF